LTSADCRTLATLLTGLGQVERALSWVERGLALDTASLRSLVDLLVHTQQPQ
jgi:hypothetical protein